MYCISSYGYKLEEFYLVDECAFESVFRGFVMTTCYVASGSDAIKAIHIKYDFHMSPLEHMSLEVR